MYIGDITICLSQTSDNSKKFLNTFGLLHIEVTLYSDKHPNNILYTKVSDKMAFANSADPDQTAPNCFLDKRRIYM